MSGFSLDDYVTVAERIEQFYAKHPDGSLQAEVVELSERLVVVRASAFRSPDDPRPGIAHSSLGIPGTTPYTRGSELENAETSAVGRAIALLGFGVKKSIASRNEIEAKAGNQEPAHEGSLIGYARITDKQNSDGQLRQTPEGWRLGFRLAPMDGDKGAILVEANGPLAEALAVIRDEWVDARVTCWGMIEPREFTPSRAARPVRYQALVLSKIQTPTVTLPSDATGNAYAERGGVVSEPTAEPSAPLDPEIEQIVASL